jgi:RNA polymerase sigma-70 factor (ECF subfamily)
MTDGAFKVAVHRLRKRFRDVVKSRIAETVHDPADIVDELHYLIRALIASPLESQ